jgi:penicillin-binding protein 2
MKNNPQLSMNSVIGKDGLEKSYDNFLEGKNGIDHIEVDSKGQAQRLVSSTSPEPGDNLYLTINSGLEQILADSLQAELQSSGGKAGSAVAIDPRTGAVLAMVSLPTYDNNIFSKGTSQEAYQKLINDPNKPLFNRSTSGTYPSGSSIKPFIASAGLQDGVITANTTINAPASITVGNYVYPDWKLHGLTDVRKAIAESVNIFFYAVGGGWDKIKGLGAQKMHDYLIKFGFGSPLGIDLPSEASGLIPDPAWKEKTQHLPWYLGDSYHMAIGQGDVLVTPLQMANGIATIANGGTVLKPYLVSKITDQNGKVIKENQKVVLNSGFISAKNIQIVQQGMRQAVTAGSARELKGLPIPVAAKTGTAQYGDQDKTHAWMVAYAPYNDPQIAIAVILEGGGEGYATAGPVVNDALSWYFSQ